MLNGVIGMLEFIVVAGYSLAYAQDIILRLRDKQTSKSRRMRELAL